MPEQRHLLVVGASGVIGTAAVAHFAALEGWTVTSASRRRPILAPGLPYCHLPLDLADAAGCEAATASIAPVTHVIYAAVKEAPGLVAGWQDEALIAQNGRMFAHVLDPLAKAGALRHVAVLQGTKAYGAHRHPVAVPAREDRPRDDHPNFYWLHEDHARALGSRHGFAVTCFRPQVLLGTAPGAAMNPAAAIGAYAALCRATGRPFAFPGNAAAMWEVVDAGLLARAFAWSFATPATEGETYNLTNGDVLVPGQVWDELADRLGLPRDGTGPGDTLGSTGEAGALETFFSLPDVQAAWARLAREHDLAVADLSALLGQSHLYVDLLLSPRIAARSVPLLVSTIKIRQAGFGDCIDSLESLVANIREMVALRLLPPFGARA